MLLLITNGERHDIDIYAPLYLIEDARHTVREAGRLGVAPFCVTSMRWHQYLRRIFGDGNFRVLDRIETPPKAKALPSI